MSRFSLNVCCALAIVVFAAYSFARDWDPWNFNANSQLQQVVSDRSAVGPWKLITSGTMFLYQNIISPVNGKHCPMYPSCSSYAREAIVMHGLFWGILMSFDRLHRCGHDLRFYETVYLDGEIRFYDYPE